MLYLLHAEIIDAVTGKRGRGTGTVDDTAVTREEALEKARALKSQDFAVRITDPQGEVIPEARAELWHLHLKEPSAIEGAVDR